MSESTDIRDYIGSEWLKSRDLDENVDYDVEITGYRTGLAGGQDGRAKQKVVGLEISGFTKAMIVNVTNGKQLYDLFATWDPRELVGCRITIYQDPAVSIGGQITGGIRIRPTLPRARSGGNAKKPSRSKRKTARSSPADRDRD